MAWSPCGGLLAAGGAGGRVALWAWSSGSAASSAAAAADDSDSDAADVQSLPPPLALAAELVADWRGAAPPDKLVRNAREIVREDPRAVDGVTWLAAGAAALAPGATHALLARGRDGAAVVWALRVQPAAGAGAGAAAVAALAATALPCLGPRVLGHAGAPVAGKRAPRAGARDAGRWWHRAALELPAGGGSSAPPPTLLLVESSERGGAVLARWQLGAGAGGCAYSPALPRAPAAGAAAAAGYDAAQLAAQAVPLALRREPCAAHARFLASAGAAAAAAEPTLRASACAWRVADARPVGAAALADGGALVLLATADGRVAAHAGAGRMPRLAATAPLHGGEPARALAVAPRADAAVAAYGRLVYAYPLAALRAAAAAAPRARAARALAAAALAALILLALAAALAFPDDAARMLPPAWAHALRAAADAAPAPLREGAATLQAAARAAFAAADALVAGREADAGGAEAAGG